MRIVLEDVENKLIDRSGWEPASQEDQLRLAVQSMGHDGLADAACTLMPSQYALEGHIDNFQHKLLSLPFPTIVDCNVHELALATLKHLGEPIRVIRTNADLALRPVEFLGDRTLIKIRGEQWLGDIAYTHEAILTRLDENRAFKTFVRDKLSQGPILWVGFSPHDGLINLLKTHLGPISGTAILATRVDNVLWRKHWNRQGFEVIDSGTYTELEKKLSKLVDDIHAQFSFSDIHPLVQEINHVSARHFGTFEELSFIHDWVNRESSSNDDIDRGKLLRASQFLLHCHQRRAPIHPFPIAMAAELNIRIGRAQLGRQLLGLAVEHLSASHPVNTHALSAIGRALIRLGDGERAQYYFERCLGQEDLDITHRADNFAWLSRCVLEQMDRLRGRGRSRAVMELIARFLQKQSTEIALADLVESSDEERLRSVYYINLRLGRIMAVASEMAQTSGDVYAEKARDLLLRAIEIESAKPDAYKAIRPLLTERHYSTADPKQWMALVASAPPPVQRRLGGRV
ncbi:MAG: hypothetical protein VX589_14635 [Myxococcota bacterium]|nr:hypothetical protein [Myxococcota bacterium]